jgi:hypothetical protein
MTLEFFTDEEIMSPDTKEYVLAEDFGVALDDLRWQFGKPMILNSAARSEDYNAKIGGHPRSLHVYDNPVHPTGGCCAVDVKMTDSQERARLVMLALEHGWSVGVASSYIHLDLRTEYTDLPQVLYHYTR